MHGPRDSHAGCLRGGGGRRRGAAPGHYRAMITSGPPLSSTGDGSTASPALRTAMGPPLPRPRSTRGCPPRPKQRFGPRPRRGGAGERPSEAEIDRIGQVLDPGSEARALEGRGVPARGRGTQPSARASRRGRPPTSDVRSVRRREDRPPSQGRRRRDRPHRPRPPPVASRGRAVPGPAWYRSRRSSNQDRSFDDEVSRRAGETAAWVSETGTPRDCAAARMVETSSGCFT